VKVILVTANLPHGVNEAFLVPEAAQMLRAGYEILVAPRSPEGPVFHGHELLMRSRRESLFSPEVLRTAARRFWSSKVRVRSILRILFQSRSVPLSLKNLAVVPKAMWLADIAEKWKADHIHCHWAGTTATMAMLASEWSGIPWSLTAHRWDIVENNLFAAKVESASFVRLISESGRELAQRNGVRDTQKLRVVPMGVSIPPHTPRRMGVRPIVLCPARLVPVKGHRVLLEAWELLQSRDAGGELWLAGEGELLAELRQRAEALGISASVKFLGALRHRELLKLYSDAAISVVALASLDLGNGNHEGIPVGLIEAMSYGIPVVATATGGTPELILPGTGLLVPPGDASALADAIQGLLQDSRLREQLGEFGRKRVMDRFNVVQVVDELVREFESHNRRAAAAAGRNPIAVL
jgi:colanic acid/amylovoran biosynthesis glycosyltransferase